MGVPVPQPRQRHRVFAPKGQRAFVHNYTPVNSPVNLYKNAIREEARKHITEQLLGPIQLHVKFMLPRPMRLIWKTRPMPLVRHITKPDADNLVKALKDALTGIAWRDDCQVCELHVEKWYAGGGELPCTQVEISTLTA